MTAIRFFSLLRSDHIKKLFFFLLMLVFLIHPLSIFAATVQNADMYDHQLEMRAGGGSYMYTIVEQATVSDICELGCEIVLISTGQTVSVNPDDSVVIENDLVQVTSGGSQ